MSKFPFTNSASYIINNTACGITVHAATEEAAEAIQAHLADLLDDTDLSATE